MNVEGMIIAAIIIGVIGIVIGILLGIASEVFHVKVNEKEILVRNELPGNNCGGCGFPGCDGLAAAIVEGTAGVGDCPVGGSEVTSKIATIMGVDSGSVEKKVAFVKCKGTCDKTALQYNYYGIDDCSKVAVTPGSGEKACGFGCMGYGSCVKECDFDAIYVVDGVAIVDKEKCVACGKCAQVCPNHLIAIIPYDAKYRVQCSSQEKGKFVKMKCENGCIGCTLCIKQCEFDAIHMDNNVAVIDYDKCTNCGKCQGKCPSKIIAS